MKCLSTFTSLLFICNFVVAQPAADALSMNATIDSTSMNTLETSFQRIMASLGRDEREQFSYSLLVIAHNDVELEDGIAVSRDQAKLKAFLLSALKKLDGSTAGEIMRLANSEDYSDSRELVDSVYVDKVSASENKSRIQKSWKNFRTYTGSGKRNTSSFTVYADEWKIIYKSESSNGISGAAGHIFQVSLLEAGQKDWEGDTFVNEANKSTIKGETHIYKSGTFYFQSNSANGNWEIRVMIPDS